MIAIMVFDLTGKYIMMLYFLILFSNYATFFLYNFILSASPFA